SCPMDNRSWFSEAGAGGRDAVLTPSWDRGPPFGVTETTMTQEQKIIRAKVGLLELAKQLGNVSQACKMMGYSRDSFTASKSCTIRAASWPCRRSAARSRF